MRSHKMSNSHCHVAVTYYLTKRDGTYRGGERQTGAGCEMGVPDERGALPTQTVLCALSAVVRASQQWRDDNHLRIPPDIIYGEIAAEMCLLLFSGQCQVNVKPI